MAVPAWKRPRPAWNAQDGPPRAVSGNSYRPQGPGNHPAISEFGHAGIPVLTVRGDGREKQHPADESSNAHDAEPGQPPKETKAEEEARESLRYHILLARRSRRSKR